MADKPSVTVRPGEALVTDLISVIGESCRTTQFMDVRNAAMAVVAHLRHKSLIPGEKE